MGCGSSKHRSEISGQHLTEADRHARRKKHGFKDSGLERHRQNCVDQKKKLRHVQDPAEARQQKLAKIRANNKKKPTGPLGVTENDMEAARRNLKHRK